MTDSRIKELEQQVKMLEKMYEKDVAKLLDTRNAKDDQRVDEGKKNKSRHV